MRKGDLMSDINYEIMAEIGAISENKAGWKKELNLIAWNGRAPKFDLRDWAPDHAKMGKASRSPMRKLHNCKQY